ncbi:MAG: hypothetical protein V1792_02390 [Pseudomonadota bacterium]
MTQFLSDGQRLWGQARFGDLLKYVDRIRPGNPDYWAARELKLRCCLEQGRFGDAVSCAKAEEDVRDWSPAFEKLNRTDEAALVREMQRQIRDGNE